MITKPLLSARQKTVALPQQQPQQQQRQWRQQQELMQFAMASPVSTTLAIPAGTDYYRPQPVHTALLTAPSTPRQHTGQQQQQHTRDRAGSTVSVYNGFGDLADDANAAAIPTTAATATAAGDNNGGAAVAVLDGMLSPLDVAGAGAAGGGGTIQRGDRKSSVYLGFANDPKPCDEEETRL